MFKGPKPPGQPRSLRSIVESQNDSKHLQTPPALPEQGTYRDDACNEAQGRREGAAGKSPFQGVKNG